MSLPEGHYSWTFLSSALENLEQLKAEALPEGHYYWPPLSETQAYLEQLKAEALCAEAKRRVMAAELYERAVFLYIEEGERLRAATVLRRYAQHCERCGYRFGETGKEMSVNREYCDENVGDRLCWKEQERERDRERRQQKKDGPTNKAPKSWYVKLLRKG